jgi:hypothetical protein
MNNAVVQKISKEIYRRFPDFSGTRPKIRQQTYPNGSRVIYLLTFQKSFKLETDQTIIRWIRVSTTSEGKILKVSTSR